MNSIEHTNMGNTDTKEDENVNSWTNSVKNWWDSFEFNSLIPNWNWGSSPESGDTDQQSSNKNSADDEFTVLQMPDDSNEIDTDKEQRKESGEIDQKQKYESIIKELQERRRNDQSEIQRYKDLNDNLKSDLHRLKQQNEHLRQQLSMEWSRKVSSDESSIENVNVKNRPMNIADEMQTFVSQEWLDSKNSLDIECGGVDDKTKLKFLCDILLIAEQMSRIHFDEVLKQVYGCFEEGSNTHNSYNPSHTLSPEQTQPTTVGPSAKHVDMSTIPNYEQLKTGVGDFLRYRADYHDTTPIIQKTKAELSRGGKYKSILSVMEENENMRRYFTAAASLTWKMLIQRPPMVFNVQGVGTPYDPRWLELYYTSVKPDDPKSVIQYFVYPCLLHGTQVMLKGKVFVM